MIDIDNEDLIRVPTEATKYIPGRPNPATVWRWYKRGVRGVRLETAVVGGRRYTSRQAIQRFIDRCTAAADGPTASSLRRTRARAIAQAEKELDQAGI